MNVQKNNQQGTTPAVATSNNQQGTPTSTTAKIERKILLSVFKITKSKIRKIVGNYTLKPNAKYNHEHEQQRQRNL